MHNPAKKKSRTKQKPSGLRHLQLWSQKLSHSELDDALENVAANDRIASLIPPRLVDSASPFPMAAASPPLHVLLAVSQEPKYQQHVCHNQECQNTINI